MTTAPFEPGSDPSIVPDDPGAPDILEPGVEPTEPPGEDPTES